MSPERARIFHAEDDPTIRKIVKRQMERGGHEVVAQAETLEAGLETAAQAETLQLDVAILDGNLGPKIDCYDGETIAAALRAVKPDIKIISLSNADATFGDINIPKEDVDAFFQLPERIKTIEFELPYTDGEVK